MSTPPADRLTSSTDLSEAKYAASFLPPVIHHSPGNMREETRGQTSPGTSCIGTTPPSLEFRNLGGDCHPRGFVSERSNSPLSPPAESWTRKGRPSLRRSSWPGNSGWGPINDFGTSQYDLRHRSAQPSPPTLWS